MGNIINITQNKAELNLEKAPKYNGSTNNSQINIKSVDSINVNNTFNKAEEYTFDAEISKNTTNAVSGEVTTEQLTQMSSLLDTSVTEIENQINSLKAESQPYTPEYTEMMILSGDANQVEQASASIAGVTKNQEQIKSLTEELASLKYYKSEIEREINLKPYNDIANSADFKSFVNNYDPNNAGLLYNKSEGSIEMSAMIHGVDPNEIDMYSIFEQAFKDKISNNQTISLQDLKDDWAVLYADDKLENFYFMTDQQRNIYHYLFQKEGKDSAEDYMYLIQDEMNMKKGAYNANEFIKTLDLSNPDVAEETIIDHLKTGGKGIGDGINTFFTGLNNAIIAGNRLATSDYETMYIMKYLGENSNLLDENYEFSQALGNMVPAMATSAIVSLVGTPAAGSMVGSALIGISAEGNAYRQAKIEGHDDISSRTYGLLVGASEATLGYFLGRIPGISKYSGFSLKNLFLEGTEEFSQEWLDAGFRKTLIGEDINLDEVADNSKKSFVMGVMMAGLLNGGSHIANFTVNGQQTSINVDETLKYIQLHPEANIMDAINHPNSSYEVIIPETNLVTDPNSREINVNQTYKGYDKVLRVDNHGFNEALSSDEVVNNPAENILIEIPNTNELSLENIAKIPDNVSVRVIGSYTEEQMTSLKSPSTKIDLREKVTYTKEELTQIMTEINKIESQIDPNWTDMGKAIFLYEYMKKNITYRKPEEVGESNTITERARKWDTLIGLSEKMSTCNGFAFIYKELLSRQGIESYLVSGNADIRGEGAHAWNVVKIDDKSFIVDIIWDAMEYEKGNDVTTGFGLMDSSLYNQRGTEGNRVSSNLVNLDENLIQSNLSSINSNSNPDDIVENGHQKTSNNMQTNIQNNDFEVIIPSEMQSTKSRLNRKIDLNDTYKDYDKVLKVNNIGLESALTSNEVINNPNENILIEIPNTNELSLDIIEKIPDNVSIRVVGRYTKENLDNSGLKPFTSLAMIEKVTYTKDELTQIMTEINKIESQINPSWSEYEKALFIYEYLKKNIAYHDINQIHKAGEMVGERWDQAARDRHYDTLTGLIDKISTCNGYAFMYQELLNRQGIECKVLEGKYTKNGEGEHAWNAVTIDGKTFLVDIIWDSIKYAEGNNMTTGFGLLDASVYEPHGAIGKESFANLTNLDENFVQNQLSNINESILDVIDRANPFMRKKELLWDLSKASLEDVTEVLNHYKTTQILDGGTVNMKSVIVDGVTYHSKYNPQEAAQFNERYKELTGEDHPVFLQEQAKALDLLLKNKSELAKYGYGDSYIETLEKLQSNLEQETPAIEVSVGKHITDKLYDISENLSDASVEDLTEILNYFNAEPIIIDGLIHHSYNDPMLADKLNTRYKELTGHNHPTYIEQLPRVIDDYMEYKDSLIHSGAFSSIYFDRLQQMRDNLYDTSSINESQTEKNNPINPNFLVHLNDDVQSFIDGHGIDVDKVRESVNTTIYSPKDLNSLLDRYGLLSETVDTTISIADIVGYDYAYRDIPPEIFSSLNSFFDSEGDGYLTRALTLFNLSKDNAIQELQTSMQEDPIYVGQTEDGKYVITQNGMHRYSVLRTLYLSELAEIGDNQDAIEELNKKYEIPVVATIPNYDITYSNYILEGMFNMYLRVERVEENGYFKPTGNVVLTEHDGNELSLSKEQLIQYIKENCMPSLEQSTFTMNRIAKNAEDYDSFREYMEKYFPNTLEKANATLKEGENSERKSIWDSGLSF